MCLLRYKTQVYLTKYPMDYSTKARMVELSGQQVIMEDFRLSSFIHFYCKRCRYERPQNNRSDNKDESQIKRESVMRNYFEKHLHEYATPTLLYYVMDAPEGGEKDQFPSSP
ncbi:hypothetical protein WISP_22583 [Willisornis vidua]|uniref:Uncharacterized protein n=1 Tax=Willisornis vidua TaxID=1566151 RepID=A0ABQ9DNI9_9PASS|nr:hypothetical protein WISP_22583 [Willisornis vidua]